ncbi:MAG: CDGSH iron-sulfur domain-containing protein [Steroidobacteraceae bacterium]
MSERAADTETPRVAGTKPFYVEAQRGDKYFWCSCGRSQRQPFCDGSHQGSGLRPVPYLSAADGEELLFCGCKQTRTPPFCDGSHNNLPGAYREDDPDSASNRRIALREPADSPVVPLDGGCYVFRSVGAAAQIRGSLRYQLLIGEVLGARHQSQFYLEVQGDESPVICFPDCHVVLFVFRGAGVARIGRVAVDVEADEGVYVRPGETLSLVPSPGGKLCVYLSICPQAGSLRWADRHTEFFDHGFPDRVARMDADQRNAMGSRYFQLLVDKRMGSTIATQFIGHIPLSKAEPHRHLYEEALLLLRGTGCLWTENWRAMVGPGDVMFLPRKQLHSLQCLSADGMDVVGLIHPGDNPSINY